MYAIVEIAGLQYKVKGDVKVGAPVIDGAKVDATVNGEVKGDKILVFKKKRRKGYQKMNGHRQIFTSITINKITAKAPAKKAAAKQQRSQLLKRQLLRNQQQKKQINKKLWLTRKV